MQEKVCLVIPCHNEAKRLDFKRFNKRSQNCFLLFVNDGSCDNTSELIKANLEKNSSLLDLKNNSGKAEAVRLGILHLKTLPIFKDASWVGYWDADLSTPLYEVENFLNYAMTYPDMPDAIFASRVLRLGSSIKRFFFRHLLGRIFATSTSIIFRLKSYDSQCGAKIFRKEIIEACFLQPFISRWIFDIEIILRMQGKNIIEYPLREWNDVSGSKLKIIRIFWQVIIDIIRLRIKYGSITKK